MLQPDDHVVWVTKEDDRFVEGEDLVLSSPEDLIRFCTAVARFYERT